MFVFGNLFYKKRGVIGINLFMGGGGGMRFMKLECVNFIYCLFIDISYK